MPQICNIIANENAPYKCNKHSESTCVLLKQYMSPTGLNKYLRGITPTKTDKLKLDLF